MHLLNDSDVDPFVPQEILQKVRPAQKHQARHTIKVPVAKTGSSPVPLTPPGIQHRHEIDLQQSDMLQPETDREWIRDQSTHPNARRKLRRQRNAISRVRF